MIAGRRYPTSLLLATALLLIAPAAFAVPPTSTPAPSVHLVTPDIQPDHLLPLSAAESDSLLARHTPLAKLLPASWPRLERHIRALSARPAVLMGRQWPDDTRILTALEASSTRLLESHDASPDGSLLTDEARDALLSE